jgi:hypothetical protein
MREKNETKPGAGLFAVDRAAKHFYYESGNTRKFCMKVLWRYTLQTDTAVQYAPICVGGRVYVVAGPDLVSLDARWGYHYSVVPLFGSLIFRLAHPANWLIRFMADDGKLLFLVRSRWGARSPLVYDPRIREFTDGDPSPLLRKMKYIFAGDYKITRFFSEDTRFEGLIATTHPGGETLWNSLDRIRPAVRSTRIIGDILQVESRVIMCQNYFGRRSMMPTGYSIVCFDRHTGEVLWKQESYSYGQRLYPGVVQEGILTITGGDQRTGFIRKVDLTTGRVLSQETDEMPFSGLAVDDGIYYFGVGRDVVAVREEDV